MEEPKYKTIQKDIVKRKKILLEELKGVLHSMEYQQFVLLMKDVDKLLLYVNGINTPKKPIMKSYQPSQCPVCKTPYYDYEECDDGYYDRAYKLERCPYCGQKLSWYESVHW